MSLPPLRLGCVDRCVCVRRTFAELIRLARQRGFTTLADLADATGAGRGCNGCRAYLQASLDTGCTEFALRAPGQPPRPWSSRRIDQSA